MTAPTPETLDWLRQCAAAPGARWHRALLAEVEGQTPPEIEPIPAEGMAWLQQSARVHGATYSQVLLHVLERIELLDQDAIEQSQSNRFCFEAAIKRLELLEAALQQSTAKGSLTVGPTPEAAPVATDEELRSLFDDDPTDFFCSLRAVYNLGRQHGAVPAPVATNEQLRAEWARICAVGKKTAAAPPAPEAGEVATDEELLESAAKALGYESIPIDHKGGAVEAYSSELLAFARAVLARWGRPAPLPLPLAGGLVERVACAIGGEADYPANWTPESRAAIREVAAWMDECGQHGCSLWLREEADRNTGNPVVSPPPPAP